MTLTSPPRIASLVAAHTLDTELAALLWLLLEARTPAVVVGAAGRGREDVLEALAGCLPAGARTVVVAPDDDFAWLPEAVELGWRRERPGPGTRAGHRDVTPADGVLVARGLGDADGVAGARARIVVRTLALGYGLLATITGNGLDDAFEVLHDPAVGTDPDERSRLGVVVAVGGEEAPGRLVAAHYVRPVALDTHRHVQRPAPAVLATWNAGTAGWDHFAWGLLPDLAGRLGIRPIELEREQARRAGVIADAARDALTAGAPEATRSG